MKQKQLNDLLNIWAENIAELEGASFKDSFLHVMDRVKEFVIDEIVFTEEMLDK